MRAWSVLASVLLAAAAAVPAAKAAGQATVGLVDPATGRWYLRDAGGGTTSFFFGNPGDAAFVGDWDCDGVDTPGLYRRSDGYVYLRNSNSQGIADVSFFFGDPGDLPLAGDFDGDGCDTVSLYRPAEARVYVIDRLGAGDTGLGEAETAYTFGNPGDRPFAGDLDGDGVDEVALHRPATGLVYYREVHAPGPADAEFTFGDPGDVVLAADWTADGTDTVGLLRPSDGAFHLRHGNAAGPADEAFAYGSGWLAPVAGDFGALPGGGGPPPARPASADRRLVRVGAVTGAISPKSVVHSGTGLFIAQNMMYRHTMTVYDRSLELVATIPDSVRPESFGLSGYPGTYRGAPVEAAFTSDGRYAYVSNYQMFGPAFSRPGSDGCGLAGWDGSFLYRVDMEALAIDRVHRVGAVPKFVAVTPDDRLVLVTNWCSFDLSVVDVAEGREVARIPLGRHPRGIAVHPCGTEAFVAVMGSRDIARVDLASLQVSGWYRGVGANPRHLVLSPDGGTLYASLNGEGRLAKIDVASGRVVAKVATGNAPRSMVIAEDGGALYVVNYSSDTLAKVTTSDMRVVQTIGAPDRPIGITYDTVEARVWVSSYSGWITVFEDR